MSLSIGLCPGHHTAAKGATNKKHGLNEHDEAVKVVEHLDKLLTDAGLDVAVFTGKLGQKIRQINAGSFSLVLDIHFNAGGGKGCEVIHVPNSKPRHKQAAVMSNGISTYMGSRDRGAKGGWYKMDRPDIVDFPGDENGDEKPDAFVSQTNCCALIPEPLFIDNDAEVEYWLVAGRHEQLAEAIAHGIADAFGG